MLDGAIPPLSVLTSRKTQPELVRKVTQGAPIWMGNPAEFYRGRMPVFYYLKGEEAADVYLYLSQYPPKEGPLPIFAASQDASSLTRTGPADPPAAANVDSAQASPLTRPASQVAAPASERSSVDLQIAAFRLSELLIVLLLAGGVTVTMLEFKRLSHKKSVEVPPAAPASQDDADRKSLVTQDAA